MAEENSKLPSAVTGVNCVGKPVVPCIREKKALLQLLVGGPYERHGRIHPYGHVALRVKTDAQDLTYDYGRYGAVWGLGDSEGEGMLRVWTDHVKYMAGENATGRTTTVYSYDITEAQAIDVIKYYEGKTQERIPNIDRGFMKQYRIEDYDALERNCTTMSVDGAKIAIPSIMNGSEKYNSGNGLSSSEKLAAKISGWPNRIFMPADLGNFLSNQPKKVP